MIHLEALGAVLQGTVILPAILAKWPEAQITWITSSAAFHLLENNPHIHRLIKNNYEGSLALRALSFDYTMCIDKSLVAAGLTELPRSAGTRLGFGSSHDHGNIVPLNSEAEELWHLGLSNHEKFFVNTKPETQLMTEALALPYRRQEYVFSWKPEELIFRSEEFTRLKLQAQKKVLGFNTGCSATLPHKKLSIDGWVELILTARERFPEVQFLLLGGPEDTERNAAISSLVQQNSVTPLRLMNTPTNLGLRKGMVYVDLCDAIVTGDSLGMHMSIALKKWTVAWFGPSCLQEIDFFGRGVGIKTDAPCAPCWKRDCAKPVMCYDLVRFDKILDAVEMSPQFRKQSSEVLIAENVAAAV